MTIFKIKSAVLRERGEKYESLDRARAEKRLKEIRAEDPRAILLSIPQER